MAQNELQITFKTNGHLTPHTLKSDLPSKKNCFIYFNESPLKMMKNAFYFILKVFFVLKIIKCFP